MPVQAMSGWAMWRSPHKQVNATPENLVNAFFLAAVRGVCRRFGYEMGREIVVEMGTRQVCINDPDISGETRKELALALAEAVGGGTR